MKSRPKNGGPCDSIAILLTNPVGGLHDVAEVTLRQPEIEGANQRIGLSSFCHGGQDSIKLKILSTNRLTGVKRRVTVKTMRNRHEWNERDGVVFRAYGDDASIGLLVGNSKGNLEQAKPSDWSGYLLAELLRCANRISELEDEVDAELRGQVEISEAGGRMHEKLSARIALLEAVVAPLLPLFRERAEAWRRAHEEGRVFSSVRMADNITLTAEFPVEALCALTKGARMRISEKDHETLASALELDEQGHGIYPEGAGQRNKQEEEG